nr:MAG TPA: Protein of unknown function (DUF2969) [Bacteriophage sp.]
MYSLLVNLFDNRLTDIVVNNKTVGTLVPNLDRVVLTMSSKDNEFSTRHRTEEDALDLAEEILTQKKTTENSRQHTYKL